MNTWRRLLLVLLALGVSAPAAAQTPVVPGAPLTVGMRTRAAYGCGTPPAILHVTNGNDSGAGSLRAALTASGPRVVVFDVSGYITINSILTVSQPCLTVAGQTAPSPGITIRSGTGTSLTEVAIYLSTRDILLQHLRFRMGDKGCNSNFQIYGGNQHNIVFDHLSVSWAQDDNIALNWTNSGVSTDLTVYRSIISEGIFQGAQGAKCTGGGATNGHGIFIGPSSQSSAYVQNLLATNFERNPYMRADTRTVVLNNLIYQWHGPWGFFFNNGSVNFAGSGTDPGGGPWYSTVVGNRFVAGAKTCCTGNGDDAQAYQFFYSINNITEKSGNQIYRRDNTLYAPPPSHVKVIEELNQYSYNPNVSAPPSQAPLPAGSVPLASATLEQALLPIVGARPADRDDVDRRTVQNVTNRTGTYVHDVAEVGGFPPLAVQTAAFAPVADPHGVAASGYTHLEEQLHGLATALEGGVPPEPPVPGPPDVPPAAGVVFVSDTFTGAGGTPLGAHRGEIGATWAKQASAIDGLVLSGAGRLLSVGVGDGTLTLADGAPRSAQYDVAADLVVQSIVADHELGIWARASLADPLTGLAFLYDVPAGTWTLTEFTAAGTKPLGACVKALAAGSTTRVVLRVRDGSVHGIVGGTQCASSSAATLHGAGLVGVSTYYPATADTDATGIHVDNLVATDVTTGGPPVSLTVLVLAVIGLLAVILVILVVLLLRSWAAELPRVG